MNWWKRVIAAMVCVMSAAITGFGQPDREAVLRQAASPIRIAVAPPQASGLAPLRLYWSDAYKDNFVAATAESDGEARRDGYDVCCVEAQVFANPQQGTVPLKLYRHPKIRDTYTTATAEGERAALAAGYVFVRNEGYIYPTAQPGTVPLKLFYSLPRYDNFSLATAENERSARGWGYTEVRVEGYVFPPTGAPPVPVTPVTPPVNPPISQGVTNNLALNKPASQSSQSQWSTGPGDAQGAVDGKKDGRWGFHTNIERNPWWQVDLLAPSAIREIRVFNRMDITERARTLQILASNTGTDWTPVYAHNGTPFGGADGKPLIVSLNNVVARYVRLQLTEENFFHLDEVEIYGQSGPPTASANSFTGNLALNKPATQSSQSQWSTGPADAQGAVDGKKNGAWGFHTAVEANPWWQVDLLAVSTIREVRVFNRMDLPERAATLQVLVSSNGTDWTRVYSHNRTPFGGNDGRPLVVSLNGTPGRYVRLQLGETNYFHLDEVEIYGTGVASR
jgi:hypothetical protein